MDISKVKKDLDNLVQKFQKGGKIDVEAKKNFLETIKFEKDYLKSNKIKERMRLAGLNPDEELPKLNTALNMMDLRVDNSEINRNGAYFSRSDNAVSYRNNGENADVMAGKYVMGHEVGHLYGGNDDGINKPYEDFIDDRNSQVEQTAIGRMMQKFRLRNNSEYYTNTGHEASWGETVADVHSARQELKNISNYDGRTSNFTNEAYNAMVKHAATNPNSASAQLIDKIGTPQKKYYDKILNKTMDELTKEDEIWLKKYQKEKHKHDAVQKKYIFDIMNRIVSNENTREVDYAKLGGILRGFQ